MTQISSRGRLWQQVAQVLAAGVANLQWVSQPVRQLQPALRCLGRPDVGALMWRLVQSHWWVRVFPATALAMAGFYLVWTANRNFWFLRRKFTYAVYQLLASHLLILSALLALVVATLALARVLRSGSLERAQLASAGLLILLAAVEGRGLYLQRQHDNQVTSMMALWLAGLSTMHQPGFCKPGFQLPKSLPRATLDYPRFKDGWGHSLVYVFRTPNQAFLISAGRNGVVETREFGLVGQSFAAGDFDHDIVYELTTGDHFGFVVGPEGPSLGGSPCLLLSAFGCFAFPVPEGS